MDRYTVKRAALGLLRVGLFAVVLLAVAGVAAALLALLGVVTVFGVVSAVLDAGPMALALVGGLGVLGLGVGLGAAYWLLRLGGRLDDELVAAVGPLDRLAALQRRYVGGEVDEAEFEAELDALLDADEVPPEARVPRPLSEDGPASETETASADRESTEHRGRELLFEQ
jgi:hypothetical protein